MRKSTLFISAALTAFILAVLAGVVSGYQDALSAPEPAAATQSAVESVSLALPSPTPTLLTPEQAAALAAQVIGRTDLYSVETADFNGLSVYMVTFSSGDVVYVSPEGQILSVTKLPTTVTTGAPARRSNNNGGGGGGGNGEHEDHEEHEEDDD